MRMHLQVQVLVVVLLLVFFQASFRMVLGGDCAVISGIIVGHWCATGITRYVLTRV